MVVRGVVSASISAFNSSLETLLCNTGMVNAFEINEKIIYRAQSYKIY